MIAAAKAANIHNFVTALPAGYETNVNTFVIIMRMIGMMIKHMGQFLQDGENGCFVSYFFQKVERSCDFT